MGIQTIRLIETIENPAQSIFYALQNFDVPWQELSINAELDFDYLFNRSGKKITSPLVDFFIDTETGKIDSTSLVMLANIIVTKYGKKWDKLYATYDFEYDPISNYDMEEKMTNDQTTHQFGHTLTRTDNLNETIENTKAGFNSIQYTPDTQTETGNTGTQTHVDSGSNTDTRNYTLTRKGNIGVTTSQQMIESERKLWLWDFIDSVVYPDIDRVLTIQTY